MRRGGTIHAANADDVQSGTAPAWKCQQKAGFLRDTKKSNASRRGTTEIGDFRAPKSSIPVQSGTAPAWNDEESKIPEVFRLKSKNSWFPLGFPGSNPGVGV